MLNLSPRHTYKHLKHISILTFTLLLLSACSNQQVGQASTLVAPQISDNTLSTDEAILTGQVAVKGPGIILIISDTLESTPINQDHTPLKIVHDSDLTAIVNYLRESGAEVIAINDERLIEKSQILAKNQQIQINETLYDGPKFTIKAIGDSQMLEGALNDLQSPLHLMENDLQISLSQEETLSIPAYTGSINYQYAEIQ